MFKNEKVSLFKVITFSAFYLQGVKWIKEKYGENLVIVRPGQRGYLDSIERAISSGDVVLIEQIEEELDPVLDPVLGRNTIKKGRAIKLGDKEVS